MGNITTLRRNSPSGIRLPSISTLAEKSNIRLPDLKSSPDSSQMELPSITKGNNDTSTATSLVQLSQNSRSLPRPIVSSPTQEKSRTKSDPTSFVSQQQQHHQQPQPAIRSHSYNYPSPPPATYGFKVTQPAQSRVLYYQQQYMTHTPQQHAMYYQGATGGNMLSKDSTATSPKAQLSCQRCGTTETPEWRRGPNGARTLCNACGLYHAKLVKRKGALIAAEEMKFKKVGKVSKPMRPRASISGGPSYITSKSSNENIKLSERHSEFLQQQFQNQLHHTQEYNSTSGKIPYHHDNLYQSHPLPPLPLPHYSPRGPPLPSTYHSSYYQPQQQHLQSQIHNSHNQQQQLHQQMASHYQGLHHGSMQSLPPQLQAPSINQSYY